MDFTSPLFLSLAARFLLSCVILWLAAHRAVLYADRLSRYLPISSFGVGALFFALTSALPELSICFNAIASNTHELSMGNLIGSSFMNATLALSIPLLLGRGYVSPATQNNALKLGIAAITISALHFFTFPGKGLLLIAFFFLCSFGGDVFSASIESAPEKDSQESALWITLNILFYLGLVFWAGHLAIPAVVEYANQTGISLEKAGATLLLFDTTLPEMVLNIQAARHGTISLALGNSLCSIILQNGLLAGILTSVHNLNVSYDLFKLLLATVAGLILLLVTLFTKNALLQRIGFILGLILFAGTLFYL